MNTTINTLSLRPAARLNWVQRDRADTLAQGLSAATCLTLMVVLLGSLFA